MLYHVDDVDVRIIRGFELFCLLGFEIDRLLDCDCRSADLGLIGLFLVNICPVGKKNETSKGYFHLIYLRVSIV
jgi:hypothetical protein